MTSATACGICNSADPSSGLLCGACVDEELRPARDRLDQALAAEPPLRDACALAVARAEPATLERHKRFAVARAAAKARQALQGVAERAHADRSALFAARAANAERRAALGAARAKLDAKKRELAALKAALRAGPAAVLGESRWRRALRVFALFPVRFASPAPARGSL
eukprot:CAMPEP_0119268824 /NCGR_PEP_ID=MMETSP1329-20130426/6471_1 /TAXON_ID=114041 /ORGANISM="Genus nov. species nov., Strain RCC1024" /LENGTH=167 /DNA_ID=CAMNT_0007268807 /DNA_START=221 /DNA_END=721 /DNA_ORIENTATION=-